MAKQKKEGSPPMTTQGVWRVPSVETEDYPGLTVCDNRVSGSINVGSSRLPLWAFIWAAIHEDWASVESSWEPGKHYNFTAEDLSHFLYCLLEMRGEFGRLLLTLADAERREQNSNHLKDDRPWWERPRARGKVLAQLKRCLVALENVEPKEPYSHWRKVGPGLSTFDFAAAGDADA